MGCNQQDTGSSLRVHAYKELVPVHQLRNTLMKYFVFLQIGVKIEMYSGTIRGNAAKTLSHHRTEAWTHPLLGTARLDQFTSQPGAWAAQLTQHSSPVPRLPPLVPECNTAHKQCLLRLAWLPCKKQFPATFTHTKESCAL